MLLTFCFSSCTVLMRLTYATNPLLRLCLPSRSNKHRFVLIVNAWHDATLPSVITVHSNPKKGKERGREREGERERENKKRTECLILQSKPEKLNRRKFERHRLNKSHLLPRTRLVPDFAQTPVLRSRQMWTRQTAWADRPCTMQQKQGRQQLWTSCWPSMAFMLMQPQQKPALPPFTLQLRLGCLKKTFFLQSSSVRYYFWKLCNIGKG